MRRWSDFEGTITARWVLPLSGPPLSHGQVTVRAGQIQAVEPAGTRPADRVFERAAILPGLVNAHVHLDLTGMRGLAPPRLPLTDWLMEVIRHRQSRSQEQIRHDIRAGLDECIRAGTTTLGDISGAGASWDVMVESGIRAVVFHEIIGLKPERARGSWEAFQGWASVREDRPLCRKGVSPHAPYSTGRWLYDKAVALNLPLATHWAETADEDDLLRHQRGCFVPFLQQVGAWEPEQLGAPEELLALCQRATPCLLAHANYMDPLTPLTSGTTVVYCPRTHAAFGHAPHPLPALLDRGTRVALGTDSLASNPDLDLLAEVRWLRRQHPGLSGERLLRLATLSGAEALAVSDETGSLEAGKSADLIVVPLLDGIDEPHDAILHGSAGVDRVMVGGRWWTG
ncbi:MAG: amidohydrolase family protein [Gemmataceae bacterium]